MKICRKCYFSNDGTQPIRYSRWLKGSESPDRVIVNGQKTVCLKRGYHARWQVKYI